MAQIIYTTDIFVVFINIWYTTKKANLSKFVLVIVFGSWAVKRTIENIPISIIKNTSYLSPGNPYHWKSINLFSSAKLSWIVFILLICNYILVFQVWMNHKIFAIDIICINPYVKRIRQLKYHLSIIISLSNNDANWYKSTSLVMSFLDLPHCNKT